MNEHIKTVFLDNNIYNYFVDSPESYKKDKLIDAIKRKLIVLVCSEDLISEITATHNKNIDKCIKMLGDLIDFNPKVIKSYPVLMKEELKCLSGMSKGTNIYHNGNIIEALKKFKNDSKKIEENNEIFNKIINIDIEKHEKTKEEFKKRHNEYFKDNSPKAEDYHEAVKGIEEKGTLRQLSINYVEQYMMENENVTEKEKINEKVAEITRKIQKNTNSPIRKYGIIKVFAESYYFQMLKKTIKKSFLNDIKHLYSSSYCDYFVTDNTNEIHYFRDVLKDQCSTECLTYHEFANKHL